MMPTFEVRWHFVRSDVGTTITYATQMLNNVNWCEWIEDGRRPDKEFEESSGNDDNG